MLGALAHLAALQVGVAGGAVVGIARHHLDLRQKVGQGPDGGGFARAPVPHDHHPADAGVDHVEQQRQFHLLLPDDGGEGEDPALPGWRHGRVDGPASRIVSQLPPAPWPGPTGSSRQAPGVGWRRRDRSAAPAAGAARPGARLTVPRAGPRSPARSTRWKPRRPRRCPSPSRPPPAPCPGTSPPGTGWCGTAAPPRADPP